MKYLKLFENKFEEQLLCVDINTDFAKKKFTIGNIYTATVYPEPTSSFGKSKLKSNGVIKDDNGKYEKIFKLMNSDDYICGIGGIFTHDKSMEDYKKRLTAQQFDL